MSSHRRGVTMNVLALGAALAICLAPRLASATPSFPPIIQATFGEANPEPCTICHATLSGGLGTVVQPFGRYMQSRGLFAADLTSLGNALNALQGEGSAGVEPAKTYLEALQAGTDPNAPGASADQPEFGCGSHIAPTSESRMREGKLALLLATLSLVARRRKVSHTKSSR